MTGAEVILQTAKDAGVKICFANKGTTELPIVAAFDKVSGIRPVLGLLKEYAPARLTATDASRKNRQ